jgi:alkylhydroperoxidase/carboxymuconolactone decarboxylase family protein
MDKSYYDPKDLKKFANIAEFEPKLAAKFFDWYNDVFKEGALTEREKSLIALAVAHAIQCPYCIDAYTEDSIQKGCNEAMLMEAVHVTGATHAGAFMVPGVQMMNKAK